MGTKHMRFMAESLVAGALAAVVLTFAGPASADLQVVVGQTLVIENTFDPDPTGMQCTVDIQSVTAPSSLGDNHLSYSGQVQTGEPWTLNLKTSLDNTRPGFYTSDPLTIVFAYEQTSGGHCHVGGTITVFFHVLPRIDRTPWELWWFNGEEPEGYLTKSTLTAHPANFGPFTWSDFFNSAQVLFFDGKRSGPSLTTVKNTVQLIAGDSTSSVPAEIQVTVNGEVSARHFVTVNRPASLRRFISADSDSDQSAFGFISLISYKILDRFGKILPHNVPAVEHYTGPVIKDLDFANPNWPRVEPFGDSMDPSRAFFIIAGCSLIVGQVCRPIPLPPHQPHRGQRKVNHWDGEIAIGSAVVSSVNEPAFGVVVQQHVFQKFQDHARHCDIASPPGVTPIPGCPGLR